MEKLGAILERDRDIRRAVCELLDAAPFAEAGLGLAPVGRAARRATVRVGAEQFDAAAEALRSLPPAVRGRIRLVLKPQFLSRRKGKSHGA